MALVRASCQGGTLADIFRKAPTSEEYALMLELIPLLEEALSERNVWALTSHKSIVLLAKDDYTSPGFVTIIPKPAPDAPYEIHFVASATESPWPDAIVMGNAATKERAVEMVLTAIARSDGWR